MKWRKVVYDAKQSSMITRCIYFIKEKYVFATYFYIFFQFIFFKSL
jgi:hypothetical protein